MLIRFFELTPASRRIDYLFKPVINHTNSIVRLPNDAVFYSNDPRRKRKFHSGKSYLNTSLWRGLKTMDSLIPSHTTSAIRPS